MRQKNLFKRAATLLYGLFAIAAVAFLITACQKKQNETAILPEKNKMQEAADLLKGELVSGQLENVTTEEGVVYLDFNQGKKAIFIQLPAGETSFVIPSLSRAEIISSSHGVIIKDPSSEKVLLFPQNDTESLQVFEKVSSIFQHNTVNAPIAGTTLINFNS